MPSVPELSPSSLLALRGAAVGGEAKVVAQGEAGVKAEIKPHTNNRRPEAAAEE